MNIEEGDVKKKIYFLDNTDGIIISKTELNKDSEYGIDNIEEEHHHDFLKELNESNVELYINNIKYKYEKYFIHKKKEIILYY